MYARLMRLVSSSKDLHRRIRVLYDANKISRSEQPTRVTICAKEERKEDKNVTCSSDVRIDVMADM